MRLPRFFRRLCLALSREKLQLELEDELASHLEFEVRKYMQAGLREKDARRQAQIAFGSAAAAIESCREERGTLFFENLVRNCRNSFRAFRRSPGFAAAVILTIAVAVGANTTVFTLCKAMLLASLPVANAQELSLISIAVPGRDPDPYFSFPDLQRIRKRVSHTAALAGFTETVDYHLLDESGTSSTIRGQLVTGNFFEVLGVSPASGRLLNDGDNDPGRGTVAVLSDRFWKARFGGGDGAIGKRLLIQRHPVTVIGVAPRGFEGMEPGVQPDLWMPLSAQPAVGFDGYASMNGINIKKPWLWQDVSWLHVVARAPHVSRPQLVAQLSAWLRAEIAVLLPQVSEARERAMLLNARIEMTNGARGLPRLRARFSRPLEILLALVIVLLVSGCVNVINLLLARSRAQAQETAIRAALGGSPLQLAGSRATETLLLAMAGGVLSLPLAIFGARWILQWLVTGSDLQIELAPDWTMLAFTGAVTLLAGLAVALLTAWQSSGIAVNSAIGHRTETNAGLTRARARLSSLLVAGQLAVSITALVVAGLLTHTLLNYQHLDVGMDRQHVLSVGIDPSAAGYNTAAKSNAFYAEVTAAIDRIPGVISSSVAGCGLMDNGCATLAASVRGVPPNPDESLVERNYVGAAYFSTVGMRVLRGRGITTRDTLHTLPIGVVNTAFERQFLSGQSALGRFVQMEGREIQIVGVVQNARSDNIHHTALPYIFLAIAQAPGGWNISHIEVRARTTPQSLASRVRSAIFNIDRAIPISEMTPLASEINRGLASELLAGRLAGLFSTLILLIAGIGLYGILAYEVTQRRQEFAIRMALGANKQNVIHFVVKRASWIWAAGCSAGVAVSYAAARFAESLLFDTPALDKASYATAILILLLVSTIAVVLPAWRASKADPSTVLRSE